jgi:FMN phosphatase YigB (HAD superfamily)
MNKSTILFDIDYTVFDTGKFKDSDLQNFQVYPDCVSTLTQLSQIATLGILSEGTYDLQMEKLVKTDILIFFSKDDIHIVENKTDTLQHILGHYRDTDVSFVEDKLTMLQQATEILPNMKTFWLKRGPYAEDQKSILGFSPDHTIDSLSMLISLIQKK